jgi:hypothetical protein
VSANDSEEPEKKRSHKAWGDKSFRTRALFEINEYGEILPVAPDEVAAVFEGNFPDFIG